MNESVLVVEDEGIVAMHIQNSLKNLGYTVSGIASSGEEAIEMVKNSRPDIVLMDIVLKGMVDGIEAADNIRKNFDIPTIYLTAYGDESTLNRAKITEPYGYLLKPFKERDLHIAIEIAIYKHGIEARLKTIDRFLSAILKNIGDAIITTDIEGRITFSNVAAGALTGWDIDQVSGKNLTEVFKIYSEGGTEELFGDLAYRMIRDDIFFDFDPYTILISKDGKKINVDGKGAPLRNEKGATEGMIFIFRDITKRKQAEDEVKKLNIDLEKRILERTEELVKRNKELETMLDGFVMREMKMIELKKKIAELEKKIGKTA